MGQQRGGISGTSSEAGAPAGLFHYFRHVLPTAPFPVKNVRLRYALRQLKEKVVAVVPLALCMGLFLAVFSRGGIRNGGQIGAGIVSMVFGLLLFLEGIKTSVKPMGELIGKTLAQHWSLSGLLTVCFFLGVLVAFAEPAIAALVPLAALVEADRTPLLYYILNEGRTYLVISIGLGVGTATAVGAWKTLTGRPLLPQIYAIFIPTLVLAMYMKFGDKNLEPLIGLSWDCGAITTGPITASAIIAVSSGIGEVSSGQSTSAASTLGIVSLAPLYPIFCTELLAVILSFTVDKSSIGLSHLVESSARENGDSVGTLLQAAIDAIQAAVPLLVFLFVVLKIVVQKDLPTVSWEHLLGDKESIQTKKLHEEDVGNDCASRDLFCSEENDGSHSSKHNELDCHAIGRKGDAHTKNDKKPDESRSQKLRVTNHGSNSKGGLRNWIYSNALLLAGTVSVPLGLFLINVGIQHAIAPLGDQAGKKIPGLFMEVQHVRPSIAVLHAMGVFFVGLFLFLLGNLAARAEPAVLVLGITIEELTEGTFSRFKLQNGIGIGVGIGIALGVVQMTLFIPLLYGLIVGYVVALGLSSDAGKIVAGASWDSGGAAMGPVTVPLILSIGISLSAALGTSQSFGILSLASVCPIVLILLVHSGRSSKQ